MHKNQPMHEGRIVLPDNTIYGMFERAVCANRDKVAIIENDRKLTFGELAEMVDLATRSIPEGTKTVGIMMSHRAEMIASMLAVLKMGARYVPAEPAFPAERIRFMMEESGAEVVVTESPYASILEGIPTLIIDCAVCRSAPCDACGNMPSAEGRTYEVRPEDPAYVLYTSGTTGRPKGICVANSNVCNYARAFADEFQPRHGDVMLQYSVCTFDIFVEEVYASLLSGMTIAIPPKPEREDTSRLMQFVKRHGVTIISGFPQLLASLNAISGIPESVRLLISGGDVLRARFVDKLVGKFEVYNTYGPSETTVCATYFRCNGYKPLDDGTYPIGKPILGVKVRVLDSGGEDAEVGKPGEICILGKGVSLGYIGSSAGENRAFERLFDGEVMYHSGDVGYMLADGNIAFLHRLDSQVMVDGRRVELMEVERALNRSEAVSQAVVRALADSDDAVYITAYVVMEDDDADVGTLREELAKSLADFMIPEFFVRVPSIPLNENGKPDIAKLPVVMRSPRGNQGT